VWLGDGGATGDFTQSAEDPKTTFLGNANHEIRTLRGPTHTEHGIAPLEQPFCYRVEDLLERLVADTS
jgi:hypothetical protein